MIRIGYVFVVGMLLLPIAAGGEETQTGGQAEQQRKEQPKQQEKSSKPQSSVNTDFQPTERIKADTVVAFPADI